jgi:hypothetical protein
LSIGSKLRQAIFRKNFRGKGVSGVSCRVLDCLAGVAHSAAKPEPKEFNRGFHGFHGLEMISDQRNLIAVIRATIVTNHAIPTRFSRCELSKLLHRSKFGKKGICPQITQMDADEDIFSSVSASICGQFRIRLRLAALGHPW